MEIENKAGDMKFSLYNREDELLEEVGTKF